MSAIVRIATLSVAERLELSGRFARADRDGDRLDIKAGGPQK